MGCLKFTERDYIQLQDYSEKTAYSRFFYEVPIDPDGNMLTDGTGWNYTWNGENRMVQAVKTDDTKIEFKYDFMGRRFEKKKYSWNSSAWQLDTTEKYVWNAYNLVAIYNASSTLQKTMLYGLDINGGMQTAGGVGGLLFVNDVVNTKTYLPVYDGNGNVRVYLDSSDGSKVAEYDYSTDTEFTIKTGTKADELAAIGSFSTKPYDIDLDAYLYELRINRHGRWLSRDPIGENGGANLYAMVNNDNVNKSDYLGLMLFAFDGTNNVPSDNTNVYIMHNLYDKSKQNFYYSGIGNITENPGTTNSKVRQGTGWGMAAKIRDAVRDLKLAMTSDSKDNCIDVIGFSRGGVTAVQFVNKLKNGVKGYGKLKVRFLGLFDPVPGPRLGKTFLHSIPNNTAKTNIAYSIDENRDLFKPIYYSGLNVTAKKFRGGHADIGGGYKKRGLANFTLAWMVRRARAAGAPFRLPQISDINPKGKGFSNELEWNQEKMGPSSPRIIPYHIKADSSYWRLRANKPGDIFIYYPGSNIKVNHYPYSKK